MPSVLYLGDQLLDRMIALYESGPATWCRDRYARDAWGGEAEPTSSSAASWCLLGAGMRVGFELEREIGEDAADVERFNGMRRLANVIRAEIAQTPLDTGAPMFRVHETIVPANDGAKSRERILDWLRAAKEGGWVG